MDGLTIAWIICNKYKLMFSNAESVDELKKMVANKLFPHSQPDQAFIKGARLVNWDNVYKFVKNYE